MASRTPTSTPRTPPTSSARSERLLTGGFDGSRMSVAPPQPAGIASDPQANRKDTQVTNLCYERPRGAARAREPGSAASEARMTKRSRRAASGGPEPVASVRRRARAAPSPTRTGIPHRLKTCDTRGPEPRERAGLGFTPPTGLPGSTSRRRGSPAAARRRRGRDGSSRRPCTAAGRTAGGGRT